MPPIVPRWEWRTFGPRFAAADAAFAAMEPTGTQESDELYLVSPDSDTVKVRHELMDIKLLRETDAAGLQRWEPTLKTGLPLDQAAIRQVAAALRVQAPPLERDWYTLDQLIDEVLVPTGLVRAVPVHKRRVRYSVLGCTAEVSDVVADGRATRTIAIESPNAAAVLAAVASVGLEGYVNTSYPRGLAALLDGVPPRFAVIDVGTNSVKFHIGERDADGGWRVVVDRAEVTRLGEGLHDDGDIAPEPLRRTTAAIAGMVEEARRQRVLAIVAVGTAGLRAARNQAVALDRVRAETGIAVRVISGEEESRLAYLAAVASGREPGGSIVVFDTGGGSTQFTFGHGTRVDDRFSLPIGAVRFTERFGLAGVVSLATLDEARAAIAAEFATLDGRPVADALVAMGGAVTNMAAVKHELATYDPDVVHLTTIDGDEIERQIELYRSRDADERRAIVGLQPNRADVILAGACIVREVMAMLGHTSLTVCDRGLRHGLLVERFG
jgi:exopolyphosphatase / guanosine-5'-triphosphate,3'-diphosphate pyrophosphatase